MHDRTARSFTSTVHAPHAEIPQPNLVPVMPRVSRSAHNSGVSGSRSSVCARPLMVTEMGIRISKQGLLRRRNAELAELAEPAFLFFFSVDNHFCDLCGFCVPLHNVLFVVISMS